jgi:hypothetical protein
VESTHEDGTGGGVKITQELREWLAATHHEAPHGEAVTRAQDPVTERLLTLTRPLRPRRATVDGAVVLHHPSSGAPFAASSVDRIVVAARSIPGTLPSHAIDELPGWVVVDPFPPDVAFASGVDVLRRVLAQAFEHAAR